MNPLLKPSTLKFEAIDFNSFTEDDFLPALKSAIEIAKKNLEKIKNEKEPNFENIIVATEELSPELDHVSEIYHNLYSAQCTDKLSSISQEFQELLTHFSDELILDQEYFNQVKAVYENTDKSKLSIEENRILEKTYKSFVKNGALLTDDDKEKLKEINQKLSKLKLNFSENVRKATNEYFLEITDLKDLEGMPQDVIDQAKEEAQSRDLNDSWVFTLQFPSYVPFMTYCKNRELRHKLSDAYGGRAFGGDFDNSQNVIDIAKLRYEKANLLGFETHAHFVLQDRMAKTPETVFKFLQDLEDKSMGAAKKDYEKLNDLMFELDGVKGLERFDTAYYSEILKKRELSLDDEMLKPYFKIENVIDGVFQVANKLFGLVFEEDKSIPVYHPDVKAYNVHNEKGEYISLFYTDFFPRAEKRPGAWMTTFRNGGLQFGEVKRPFVSIVCNFTKPTKTKPSLLSLTEVTTLFHEFGHALHGMMTQCKYRSIAGTNVYWDFVELPSQIMENWVLERETLDLFANHYETGEKMPEEYIVKIQDANKFLEGLATVRQLSFGALDMKWHGGDPTSFSDVKTVEDSVMNKYSFAPSPNPGCMSTAFGHLFAGGYSAGYYSYKWAEVLDADAFKYFKENGIFNKDIADKFRTNILEKGGSEDPMELYKKFRGQEPTVDALLERAGLI